MYQTVKNVLSVLAVVLLCIGTLALASQKGPQQSLLSKHGTGMQVIEGTAPASTLPPVGSRRTLGALDEIIISEGFEGMADGSLPPGWIQVDVDGGFQTNQFNRFSTWQVYNYGVNAHSGTNIAMDHYNDAGLANDDWLILPMQTLGAPITLSYWRSSQDPDYLDDYELRISTTGADPTDFTDLLLDENQVPVAWVQQTIDLSDYAGVPFYIAFHYNSVDEFVFKVDDVLLEGTQQAAFGNINGFVTESEFGLGLSGATVTIEGTAFTTTTDADGLFGFSNVPVGTYDVSATRPLYGEGTHEDVEVTDGGLTAADIELVRLPYNYETDSDPVPINDNASASMTLDIADDVVIEDMDVTIHITHTYDSDLTITFTAPSSDVVALCTGVGAGGDNFINTRFDDEAATPIANGAAPFTGSFSPEGNLSDFDGLSTQGTWTLTAADGFDLDTGTIDYFYVHVTVADAIGDNPAEIPASLALYPNYPNPFNPTTAIKFDVGQNGPVKLVVYNVLGKEIAVLVDGVMTAGSHSIYFNAVGLPSGLYFARMTAAGFEATQKLVLLK